MMDDAGHDDNCMEQELKFLYTKKEKAYIIVNDGIFKLSISQD